MLLRLGRADSRGSMLLVQHMFCINPLLFNLSCCGKGKLLLLTTIRSGITNKQTNSWQISTCIDINMEIGTLLRHSNATSRDRSTKPLKRFDKLDGSFYWYYIQHLYCLEYIRRFGSWLYTRLKETSWHYLDRLCGVFETDSCANIRLLLLPRLSLSVCACPSTCSNSRTAGRIFMKFGTGEFTKFADPVQF
jgi:hypothetical protein